MTYDLVVFVLLAVLALVLAGAVSRRSWFPFSRDLLMVAVLLRIFGSTARYEVLERYYNGVGDAVAYYKAGLLFADRLWRLDLSVFSVDQWLGGPGFWWGTSFLSNLSGLVLTVIGPSRRGEFLIFSLIAFSGLVLMALAVHRAAGQRAATKFATLLFLWPSLWFWPSSIGKEAIITFGIGLTLFGYVGGERGTRWLPLLGGIALTFAIRPHVALTLAAATAIAAWVRTWQQLRPRRVVQAVAVLVLLGLTFRALTAEFGLLDADLEGFQEFVAFRAERTLTGGSSIGGLPTGVTAVPMAFVNIWLRPFPWDAHNLMAAISAVEMIALWVLILLNRRSAWLGLTRWRHHPLTQFAVPFLIGYTLMIGLTFGNLGIIARQRSPLFPCIFLLLCSSLLFAVERLRKRERPPPGVPEPPREEDAGNRPGRVAPWA